MIKLSATSAKPSSSLQRALPLPLPLPWASPLPSLLQPLPFYFLSNGGVKPMIILIDFLISGRHLNRAIVCENRFPILPLIRTVLRRSFSDVAQLNALIYVSSD